MDEAIVQYQQALQLKPDYAGAHNNLGNALLQKGRVEEAIVQYQQALQNNPNYLKAQGSLAWLLATAPLASQRNGNQAVELAERANQSSGGANPMILRALAAAYAETGRFDDAAQTIQRAIDLAQTAGQASMAATLNNELNLYKSGRPFPLENNK
jgi:tetratricopeptide (TPR) repeat protein